MRPSSLLAVATLACAAGACRAAASRVESAGVWVERRILIMGTSLDLAVEAGTRAQALEASELAVQALEAAEARLSTWRDDTELARLNQAPAGRPQVLSPALAADLAAARRCWEETNGAFDPAIGALVEAWGLRRGGRLPAAPERREAVAAGGMAGLRLGPGATAVRQRPGLVLDEGGFGKGAGLADALAVLAGVPAVSRAVLDLGGQLAVLGEGGGDAGGRWTVPIADPRRRDRPVVALAIDPGSVSTSGNSERGIVVDGRRYGHILDPRTGEPVPDVGSVTVWAEDPLRADCLSTGLYVLGPEGALAWAASHPGVEVLVLQPDGKGLKALASPGLRGRLEPLDSAITIDYGGFEKPLPGRTGR